MLKKIKKDIENMLGKSVKITVNNIRNKSEKVEGEISEVYDRIFIVNSIDGIKRSFSYSDVLTGTIEII